MEKLKEKIRPLQCETLAILETFTTSAGFTKAGWKVFRLLLQGPASELHGTGTLKIHLADNTLGMCTKDKAPIKTLDDLLMTFPLPLLSFLKNLGWRCNAELLFH